MTGNACAGVFMAIPDFFKRENTMNANIIWLGHSAVQLTLTDGRVVLIDPWLRDNPACPDRLKRPSRCDFIILTHGHGDHVGDAASLIKTFNPPVVANYDLCSALRHTIGPANYQGMNTGGTIQVAGLRISLTRAYHSSAIETPSGLVYGGMPNGVVVEAPGLAKVYHAGDTDVFSDMSLIARLFKPRIAMLPIGDLFTMGAAGAALAAELIDPAVIIPLHYRTFPFLASSADGFREALPAALKPRLRVPDVGQALTWTADGVA